jgi:hypothetical protein
MIEFDTSFVQFVAIQPSMLAEISPIGIAHGGGAVSYILIAFSPFKQPVINLGALP